jgi:hypothetical protein
MLVGLGEELIHHRDTETQSKEVKVKPEITEGTEITEVSRSRWIGLVAE